MNISFNDIVNVSPVELIQVRILQKQTRKELRQLAKMLGVPQGQNKVNTILNLVSSNKFELRLSLVPKVMLEIGA